jgi:hypothetical protein
MTTEHNSDPNTPRANPPEAGVTGRLIGITTALAVAAVAAGHHGRPKPCFLRVMACRSARPYAPQSQERIAFRSHELDGGSCRLAKCADKYKQPAPFVQVTGFLAAVLRTARQ